MQVAANLDSGSINRLEKQGVFIIGLAGPSGSGKSTVAKHVAPRLDGHVLLMENLRRGDEPSFAGATSEAGL